MQVLFIIFLCSITCTISPYTDSPMHIRVHGNSAEIILAEQCASNAKKAYPNLENNPLFNRTILQNPKQLELTLNKENPSDFTVQTSDNTPIRATFFNRNSTTLMIVGPGFPTPRQCMAPFTQLFPSCDIVLFDYRGQGREHITNWKNGPSQTLGALSHKFFGVDMSVTALGTIEAADVKAVVHAMKKKKNYDHVYGLGLCYSSFIFAQAAAEEPGLFDKLIFDSSWPSLKRIVRKIIQDPSAICNRQPPTSPCPWLTHKECFQDFVCNLVRWITHVNIEQATPLKSCLEKITVPILFFQGIKDHYCSSQEFEILWGSTSSDKKIAVFTTNQHGRNHLWQKEMYADICNHFLDHDHKTFVNWLSGSDEG